MQKIIEVELGDTTQENANDLLKDGWKVLSITAQRVAASDYKVPAGSWSSGPAVIRGKFLVVLEKETLPT